MALIAIEGTLKKRIYTTLKKESYWNILSIVDTNGVAHKVKGTTWFPPSVGDRIVAHGKPMSSATYGDELICTSMIRVEMPVELEACKARLKQIVVGKNIHHTVLSGMISKCGGDGRDGSDGSDGMAHLWDKVASGEGGEPLKAAYEEYTANRRSATPEQNKLIELQRYFEDLGCPLNDTKVEAIAKHLGGNAMDKINEDIICLLHVDGIGYKTVDKLAKAMELTPHARCKLFIMFKLEELAENDGHTCRDIVKLNECWNERGHGEADSSSLAFANALNELIEEGHAVNWNRFIYTKPRFEDEKGIADAVRLLVKQPPTLAELECGGGGGCCSNSPDINCDQRDAIMGVFRSNISVITGAAGTGKSTVLKTLVDTLAQLSPNTPIGFFAPTAKAAARISAVTNRSAYTIHRWIGFVKSKTEHGGGGGGGSGNGDFDDLFKAVNSKSREMYVVVVDEMSMVDNKLFKDALTTMMAPNSNGVFILLGDVNQLSSIGAGDVLNQLIESGKVPTTRLTTVYRQGGENGRSGIADALQSVLNGKVPTSSDGFKWIQTEDPARLKFNLCRRAELLQDIWMMTPTNSTIDAYQTHVRETINPDTDQPSFKTKFHDFRVGDKVIQRVNDYNRGVYNGMLGFVVGIEEKQIKKKVFVDGKHSVIMGNETYTTVQFENTVSAVYTVEELSQLRWAYITTVHAAQGSESKNVVVVMTHAAGRLLNRNLLYTALSRAKTSCVLLAPEMCVRMAVSTNVPKRTTNLASML